MLSWIEGGCSENKMTTSDFGAYSGNKFCYEIDMLVHSEDQVYFYHRSRNGFSHFIDAFDDFGNTKNRINNFKAFNKHIDGVSWGFVQGSLQVAAFFSQTTSSSVGKIRDALIAVPTEYLIKMSERRFDGYMQLIGEMQKNGDGFEQESVITHEFKDLRFQLNQSLLSGEEFSGDGIRYENDLCKIDFLAPVSVEPMKYGDQTQQKKWGLLESHYMNKKSE
jgi:hypothetical protein